MNGFENQIDSLLGGSLMEESLAFPSTEKEIRVPLKSVPEEVKNTATRILRITQAFINKNKDESDVRIRKTKYILSPNAQEEYEYSLTAKHRPQELESEMEIPKVMFDSLWSNSFSRQKKLRYCWQGWDIDVFEDGGVVAEFEYDNEADIPSIPDFFERA